MSFSSLYNASRALFLSFFLFVAIFLCINLFASLFINQISIVAIFVASLLVAGKVFCTKREDVFYMLGLLFSGAILSYAFYYFAWDPSVDGNAYHMEAILEIFR